MGKYQDIVKLIEHSVPDYTGLKVVPRGTPIFSDLLMTGEVRFGRRTGANFAVLNPDNLFKLSEASQVGQRVLSVDRVLSWLELGSLITFNKTEMLEVENWDTENNLVYVKSELSAAREVDTPVTLWATPIVIHSQSQAGTNYVFVRSRYQLLNGDEITFPLVTGVLNSLRQMKIAKANYAGLDVDPEYPFIYALEMEEVLPITLTTSHAIYLRAFPAYVSKVFRVPQISSGQIGPFLLDFIASPLDAITEYDEVFSIRTFTAIDVPVEGGVTHFKTVDHNHPIVNRPIWAENMIFWKMIRGYGGFILPNRFRMVASSELPNGEYAARISTRLVPALPAGMKYQFKVRAKSAGTLIVLPYPHASQVTSVPVETDTVITLETPDNGEPITRLDFIFRTTLPDSQITIADMQLLEDSVVERFQYAYVFKVIGATNFQATSVLCKPYFLSLADLKARYDDGKTYNSGFIYL